MKLKNQFILMKVLKRDTPSAWAAQLGASPVAALALNCSGFVFSFASREHATIFLGYAFGLGYHGWIVTYNRPFYVYRRLLLLKRVSTISGKRYQYYTPCMFLKLHYL
jgi:hypothetical protein